MSEILNMVATLEELAFCIAAGLFVTVAPLVLLALMTVGWFIAPYRRDLLLAAAAYVALGMGGLALNMSVTLTGSVALDSIIATVSSLLMIASIASPIMIVKNADDRGTRRTWAS